MFCPERFNDMRSPVTHLLPGCAHLDAFIARLSSVSLNFYAPLETFFRVNAVWSFDLKGGGGDREVWLSSYFDVDIAASHVPV